MNHDPPNRAPAVFRHMAIPVPAFDHLKEFQRAHTARTGQRLTLNETLALMVAEHKAMNNVEREGHEHESNEARSTTSTR